MVSSAFSLTSLLDLIALITTFKSLVREASENWRSHSQERSRTRPLLYEVCVILGLPLTRKLNLLFVPLATPGLLAWSACHHFQFW